MNLRGPGKLRAIGRFFYAFYLFQFRRQAIRYVLKNDPRLFNARYHADYFCMSVFYNQEINGNAFLPPEYIRLIMEEGMLHDEREAA